jgi:hypothetical protein
MHDEARLMSNNIFIFVGTKKANYASKIFTLQSLNRSRKCWMHLDF